VNHLAFVILFLTGAHILWANPPTVLNESVSSLIDLKYQPFGQVYVAFFFIHTKHHDWLDTANLQVFQSRQLG